jgi:hypothetical protein
VFPVAWAGDERSHVWFDNGREYTERWHHQQQIRDAVGAESLTQRSWLHPVIALFMRALPHTYLEVAAEEGAAVVVEVTGDAGGVWSLIRRNRNWLLHDGEPERADARVTLGAGDAWRHFVRQLPGELASQRVKTSGPDVLVQPFFRATAVMA